MWKVYVHQSQGLNYLRQWRLGNAFPRSLSLFFKLMNWFYDQYKLLKYCFANLKLFQTRNNVELSKFEVLFRDITETKSNVLVCRRVTPELPGKYFEIKLALGWWISRFYPDAIKEGLRRRPRFCDIIILFTPLCAFDEFAAQVKPYHL